MALILNIDTATDAASVGLAADGKVMVLQKNASQQDHAAWLQNAIHQLMQSADKKLKELDAVAVTIGPGSYTGLRVGLASAKGICYALQKPLIAVNTLTVMAHAVRNEPVSLLCPMIDARRMEVFTALYRPDLSEVKKPAALILNEDSFLEELDLNPICFSGNGSGKFKKIMHHPHAVFSDQEFDVSDMAPLAEDHLQNRQFADLAYSEPQYLKEFYTPSR
jgi:tRNA threonylcarbamoyladenosine biosynthesis protein TsaB